jgi:hypothetical protein
MQFRRLRIDVWRMMDAHKTIYSYMGGYIQRLQK